MESDYVMRVEPSEGGLQRAEESSEDTMRSSTLQPRRGSSLKPDSADTLILDFPVSSLWYFVIMT